MMTRDYEINRGKGQGWRVKPTVQAATFESDIEVEVFNDATSATFSAASSGESNVVFTHKLPDGGPTIKFDDAKGFELCAKRGLFDGDDTLSATITADRGGKLQNALVTYGRPLGSNELLASIDQSSKKLAVKLGGIGKGGWNVELSSPWDKPLDAQLKIGGRLDTGGYLP